MPRLSLATLALALLAACASTGGPEPQGDAGAATTVVVNNNLTIPAPLTVHIVPERGVRRLLGTVSPGGTATLSVGSGVTAGRYRLLARTNGGTDLLSDAFTLAEGERVTWNLQSNIVLVGRP